MMSGMQRARSNRAQAAPEFVDLCKTLYGDLIDPQVIWEDVVKAGPDSADVHVKTGSSLRTKLERGSNAVGFTAGLMAIGAAGKDPRLLKGGKFARGIHATASKVPSPLGRFDNTKTGAKLAVGAAGTQLLNVGGDAAIAGSYSDRAKKKPKGALVPVHKSVAAEIARHSTKMKNGYLHIWNGPATPKPTVSKPASYPKPNSSTLPPSATSATRIAGNDAKATRQVAQGADVANMLGTTSGKVLAGGLGATGAYKGAKAVRGNQSAAMSYVPDAMAKSIPELEWKGTFSKFDDDKHLAFGWASVVSKGGQPVIDKQGDYIAIDDIEEAAYAYVHKSRVGGDNHTRNGSVAHKVSDLVESMVFTDDKVAKMGLPHDFPRGWWVGFKVHDENVWSEVRKGNRTGFSIHGRGIRSEQSVDALMGYAK